MSETFKQTKRRQEDGTLLIINSTLIEMQHVQRTMLDEQKKHGTILDKQNTILESMATMISLYKRGELLVDTAKSSGRIVIWAAAILGALAIVWASAAHLWQLIKISIGRGG